MKFVKRLVLERQLRRQRVKREDVPELLGVAEQLNATELPVLSRAARQRIEQATVRPSKAPLVAKWSLAGAFAAVAVVVTTAQFSSPGSPLYAVKRATNDIQAFFQPTAPTEEKTVKPVPNKIMEPLEHAQPPAIERTTVIPVPTPAPTPKPAPPQPSPTPASHDEKQRKQEPKKEEPRDIFTWLRQRFGRD